MAALLSPSDWAKRFDRTKLSGARSSDSLDASWDGSGANSVQVSTVGSLRDVPGLFESLGLKDGEDYKFEDQRYEGDNLIESRTTLSDRAKEALQGYKVSRHAYDGRHVGIVRDPSGKVISVAEPGGKIKGSFDRIADAVVIGGISAGLGGLGATLGGLTGTAATIGSGAIRGAASAGMTGGDVLRGAVMGGASAALPQIPGIKGLPSYAQSAATSSLMTALRGGNLRDVLTSGAMAAAGSGVTSGLGAAGITNPLMQSMARNVLMSRMRQAIVPARK
jgi:hypothetical protein